MQGIILNPLPVFTLTFFIFNSSFDLHSKTHTHTHTRSHLAQTKFKQVREYIFFCETGNNFFLLVLLATWNSNRRYFFPVSSFTSTWWWRWSRWSINNKFFHSFASHSSCSSCHWILLWLREIVMMKYLTLVQWIFSSMVIQTGGLELLLMKWLLNAGINYIWLLVIHLSICNRNFKWYIFVFCFPQKI